jgi:biotin--protein ligase
MNRFEALCGLLNHAGGFEPLEPAYLRQWLHTDQKVVLEEGAGAKTEVTVRGLTKTGYLLATDAAGARFELHPDGNSFDFFQGLVKKKLP